MTRFPKVKRRLSSTMFLAGLVLAVATASSAVGARGSAAAPSGGGETPLTDVLITASPNPSHYGQQVQLQWLATGFPNYSYVRCSDDRGWLVDGPYTGTITKTAGIDFGSSFRWTVVCGYDDFWAPGTRTSPTFRLRLRPSAASAASASRRLTRRSW